MNETIKVLIVDDEYIARDFLKVCLNEYFPELKVVATAEHVEDAVQKIHQYQPNLIFLDIQMPGDLGFELFKKIDVINFEVIFVTGYSDHMLEAFQVSAVGYLLKPLVTSALKKAVENAKQRLKQQQFSKRYETLVNNTRNIGTNKMKLVLSNNDSFSYLDINQIIRCEGWDKYTYIYCKNGIKHLSTKNIGQYKTLLEPLGFFTAHKSHLINPQLITQYNGTDSIVMIDNSKVTLARRRKKEFLSLIRNMKLLQ